ncbi:MAG: GPR endopeptidase [Oscillospiraceae bacterium]|jgi:spore protease|nr:GPR endopeptidase [Oscillospiraceae bacterium]
MDFRTDLAVERREILGTQEIDGVVTKQYSAENATVTEIEVNSDAGATAIGKPIGKYITVEVPEFAHSAELLDGRLAAISERLRALLPQEGAILVAGLGNDDITPDALGPKCSQKIFATRHISRELADSLGLYNLRAVCALTPGVLGQTGIETVEILSGVVNQIKPAAVITVDALAARGLSRLGRTIQMCDTGVAPGSGVGNTRAEINQKTLGVPVISVGVPTVVDAVTIACDVFGEEERSGELRQVIDEKYTSMMVTPREIDLVTDRAAKLVALSINCALQPSLSPEDLMELVQ